MTDTGSGGIDLTDDEFASFLEAARGQGSEIKELLDTLSDVINQACYDDGGLDSMALSSYADGIRLLAKHGRVRITSEYGRRVIAEWVEIEGRNAT